jgi:hypothetical protein
MPVTGHRRGRPTCAPPRPGHSMGLSASLRPALSSEGRGRGGRDAHDPRLVRFILSTNSPDRNSTPVAGRPAPRTEHRAGLPAPHPKRSAANPSNAGRPVPRPKRRGASPLQRRPAASPASPTLPLGRNPDSQTRAFSMHPQRRRPPSPRSWPSPPASARSPRRNSR